MKRLIFKTNDAVSPVIGILLMLVVTIIIAAVVSGFAGGLAGGQSKAPAVSIAATKVVVSEVYDTDWTDWNATCVADKAPNAYVLFENQGGEGMPVSDVQIRVSSLKYPSDTALIDNSLTPNSSTTQRGDKANIKDPNMKNWIRYIEVFPDRNSSVISPGTKFVLHFDFGKMVQTSTYPNYKSLDFRVDGATSSLGVTEGDYLVYDIIDRKSKKVVSSGKINIPPFTVSKT
ncbi:type IV pilin N-terminal domain-containing protein [uncultured Methanospirillum sp.]|uniref:type IV pilin N-terminal domain-containing protein n=1 Tax=uncultured Methanospirillum sp. TaxID=262503 RepID=UPI0029C6C089|nr:type IV pilin N-terminal domain-containing protein [uncultured Methanospirillum sp.]